LRGRSGSTLLDNTSILFGGNLGDANGDRTRLNGISNIYSSPVAASGRIYLTGRDGLTLVLKRSNDLEVIATNRLDERIDAAPALAGNQLFLRGNKSPYCIGEGE